MPMGMEVAQVHLDREVPESAADANSMGILLDEKAPGLPGDHRSGLMGAEAKELDLDTHPPKSAGGRQKRE
jgi:hypothetical protein